LERQGFGDLAAAHVAVLTIHLPGRRTSTECFGLTTIL
jgi:hypothetical protein